MMEQSLAQIREQPLKPAANGGFVNMKHAGDLGEGLAIEEIRGEQVALFRGKALERAGNGAGQVSELCRRRCWLQWRRRSVESIEWRLAMRSPVMIDMTLGKRGAQPAEKRTAPGVGSEGRAALAFYLAQPVELRVERVGKIVAQCA